MKDVIRDGRQEPMLPGPTFRYEDEQQPDGTILRRAVLVGELPVADGYEDEDTLYARIEQAEAERDGLRAALERLLNAMDFGGDDVAYWPIIREPYEEFAKAAQQARAALASGEEGQ